MKVTQAASVAYVQNVPLAGLHFLSPSEAGHLRDAAEVMGCAASKVCHEWPGCMLRLRVTFDGGLRSKCMMTTMVMGLCSPRCLMHAQRHRWQLQPLSV